MRTLSIAFLLMAAACSDGSPVIVEDRPAPSAVADVVGDVLSASGAPLSGSVAISCANGQFGATVPIQAEGRYHAALLTSPETVGGASGRVPCVFTGPANIRVERFIGFGPAGLPHALQFVNLRAE